MAVVQNIKGLTTKLQALAAKAQKDQASVVVGYTANYAIFVHENLEAYHEPPTQAKYLEQPARELKPELASIIAELIKKRKTMAQALLVAGLRLQRESQLLVPVDTGNLRAGAFTRLESGDENG